MVIRRDKKDFKIIDITAGDQSWSVTIVRRSVEEGPALWAWFFTVSHALVGTGAHAFQWPTWERALEEAQAYIKRTFSEADDS